MDKLLRLSASLLIVTNLFSIVGTGTFAQSTVWLERFPSVEPLFLVANPYFARLQILLSFFVFAVAMFRWVGRAWLFVGALLIAGSLASELIGTTWGVPFGKYAYSSLLGLKVADRVPMLIPMSWCFMSVTCMGLVVGATGQRFTRIFLASVFLLTWDLALDPAMSKLFPFWLWSEEGPYFGMPLLNLLGWFATGLGLMAILEATRSERWLMKVPKKFWIFFYAVTLSLPLGMCLVTGLWLAFGVTLFAVVTLTAVVWLLEKTKGVNLNPSRTILNS